MDKPAAPRGRRTKDMPSGREALLEAAVRLFAAHGYEGTDIRSVATAAGVGANLIRVHFGGKAELWTAAAERILDNAGPIIGVVSDLSANSTLKIEERLALIIQETADFFRNNPDVRDFVFRCVVESGERADLVTQRLLAPAYAAGKATFEEAMTTGLIRARHSALFFIILINALSQPHGFPALLSILAPEIPAEDAYDFLSMSVTELFLHGI
ncbi:MAG: TetR/AcrR family transcriptional regulator [Proteobacteria bacterium]|nr:TetR/AcrR family transcriptional regulator [Pseudomonadota bacterium]